jgi:hypothetical protein
MCEACFVGDRKRALNFVASDTLLHYPRIPALSDWLFRDASWLVDVMSRALGAQTGFIDADKVDLIFPKNLLGCDASLVLHLLDCFSLMHTLQVAATSGDLETRYCVPSQLSSEEPLDIVSKLSSLVDRANAPTVRRIYRFQVVPPSLVSLVVARMLAFAAPYGYFFFFVWPCFPCLTFFLFLCLQVLQRGRADVFA